jgi:hypothetical protein
MHEEEFWFWTWEVLVTKTATEEDTRAGVVAVQGKRSGDKNVPDPSAPSEVKKCSEYIIDVSRNLAFYSPTSFGSAFEGVDPKELKVKQLPVKDTDNEGRSKYCTGAPGQPDLMMSIIRRTRITDTEMHLASDDCKWNMQGKHLLDFLRKLSCDDEFSSSVFNAPSFEETLAQAKKVNRTKAAQGNTSDSFVPVGGEGGGGTSPTVATSLGARGALHALGRGLSKEFPPAPLFDSASRRGGSSCAGSDVDHGDDMSDLSDEGNDDDKILWHVRRSSIFAILSDRTKRQTLRRLRELILITPSTSPTYDRGVAHRNLADECHKFARGGHAKMTKQSYSDLMLSLKHECKTIPTQAKITIFDYSVTAFTKSATCSGLADMRAYIVNMMLWSVWNDPAFEGRDPFDTTCPRVHALDGRPVDNVDKFNTALIKNGVVFFFQFGAYIDQKINLGNFGSALLDVLGTQPEDAEELDVVVGDAFLAARAACFLSGGVHAALGSLDDLTAVRESNSKSPLFGFGCAIKESAPWTAEADRLAKFSIPNMVHGPELKRITAALPAALPLDGCPGLLVAAKRLAELRDLMEPSLVEVVQTRVRASLDAAVAAMAIALGDPVQHNTANIAACKDLFVIGEGLPGDATAFTPIVNACKTALARSADVMKLDALVAAATIAQDERLTAELANRFADASTKARGLAALLHRDPTMHRVISELATRIVAELTLMSFSSSLFSTVHGFLDDVTGWMSPGGVEQLFKPYGGNAHFSKAYVLAHELAVKYTWLLDASQLDGTFDDAKCQKIQMAALSAWASQRVGFGEQLSQCKGLSSLPIAQLKTDTDGFTSGLVGHVVGLSAIAVAASLKTDAINLEETRRGPPPGDLWSGGLSEDVPLAEWKELAAVKLVGQLDYDALEAALKAAWKKLEHTDKLLASFPQECSVLSVASIERSRDVLRECTTTWGELHCAVGLGNAVLLRNPATTLRFFKKAETELRARLAFDALMPCVRTAFENAARRHKVL